MSKRFVIDKQDISVDMENIEVKGEEVNHINVLRYAKGDNIYINEYMVNILSISKQLLTGKIIGKLEKKGEPKVNIDVFIGYLKSDKMDYVVQKAVELGVKNIIPVITKNTVVKLDEKAKKNKIERLQKIATEAVMQCGRTDEVKVLNVEELRNIDLENYDSSLICHEKENMNIQKILGEMKDTKIFNIAVIIGPEGGLEEDEVDLLKSYFPKVNVVGFGERILRAETAVNYVLSILDYEMNVI